jgi:hypothetical protein
VSGRIFLAGALSSPSRRCGQKNRWLRDQKPIAENTPGRGNTTLTIGRECDASGGPDEPDSRLINH